MDIDCSKCRVGQKICRKETGRGPEGCPTLKEKASVDAALREYDRPEVLEFAQQASVQEGQCYADRHVRPYVMKPVKTRIEETMEFARKMGFKRLGVAFCAGTSQEASILVDILESNGFEVVAVSCKVGGIPKERIGIKEEEKIFIGEFESMCNPIAQAMILNSRKTDFNILLCLCVGHDSLFLKYIDGLTTVFAVKDRVSGHNPMACIYLSDHYYRRLKGSKD